MPRELNNKTLKEKPVTEQEIIDLMIADKTFATLIVNGRPIMANAESRREYEIRAMALEHYLNTTKWVKP